VYKKILYPLKFDEFSLDALSCVLDFKKVGMEEVITLHVLDIGKLPVDKFEGYSRDKADRARALAEVKMERLREDLEKEGFKVTTRLHLGRAAADLIRIARHEDASLIVMAAHGKAMSKASCGGLYRGAWSNTARDRC
jgi:nucleotide-binding universal stress UspA family protein